MRQQPQRRANSVSFWKHMTRFIITLLLSQTPVIYLYQDAKKALAKALTLQRTNADFSITDGEGATLVIADLEREAGKR